MPKTGIQTEIIKPTADLFKILNLLLDPLEVGQMLGSGKMGAQSFQKYVFVVFGKYFRHLVEFMRLKSCSVHAGLQLNMNAGRLAGLLGNLLDCPQTFHGEYEK